jgi:hypothetical protein
MELKNRLLEQISAKAEKMRNIKTWLRSPAMVKLLETTDYLAKKHEAIVSESPDVYGTYINLTLKDLSGLKDEGLAALLDGFVCSNPDGTYSYDDANSFSRSYQFSWTGPEFGDFRPALHITVTANFKQDSETCSRVIVGYTEAREEKPKPIYALKCEGEEVTG